MNASIMIEKSPVVSLESFVEDILSDSSIPVDLLDLDVVKKDFVIVYDPRIDHACDVYRDQYVTIRVNSSENRLRQRFALAHAIGHVLLNHVLPIADTVDNFATGVVSPTEKLANAFAMELLVPGHALQSIIATERDLNIEKIAKIFQVSTTLVIERLKNLKIIYP